MLTIISGQPGNGKTLKAMAEMEAAYLDNQRRSKLPPDHKDYQPEREFYSNVAGATREENPDAFPWVQRMPEHNDWTMLPKGSYVQYDEGHADGITPGLERYGLLFPATGKPGESQDHRIRAMSTHRHGGYDLVIITQWPSKVHHNVRQQCGRHVHMNRSMGLQAAGTMVWSRCQPDPYDEREREKADEEVWSYPKELYNRYKSATLHTTSHKFKLPKKIKNGLTTAFSLVVVLAAVWWWMGWDLSVFFGGGEPAKAEATAGGPRPAPSVFGSDVPVGEGEGLGQLPGMGAYADLNTAPTPSLMGCASGDRSCRCFNTDGFVIDMPRARCLALLADPLPFNIKHEYANKREPTREQSTSRTVGSSSSPVAGTVISAHMGSPVTGEVPEKYTATW
ncbi:hypothetical protein LJR168_001994 [Pseudoxanthomonas sp. LjRoot168]|uniref:zonular occludens toxin domain-containing protein n=1 Tax=unclassified Pseudoxanthomonas TaxID=2645906 RepID=UPI003ECD9721